MAKRVRAMSGIAPGDCDRFSPMAAIPTLPALTCANNVSVCRDRVASKITLV